MDNEGLTRKWEPAQPGGPWECRFWRRGCLENCLLLEFFRFKDTGASYTGALLSLKGQGDLERSQCAMSLHMETKS